VFDKTEITLPAGQQVTVRFRNEDRGVLHNWALFEKQGDIMAIFRGENFVGPDTRDYTFQAPPPGRYFYVCDIHATTMTGYATFQ
jgi:plastocyanin